MPLFKKVHNNLFTECTCDDTSLVEYKDDNNEQDFMGVRCESCGSEWLKKEYLADNNIDSCTKQYTPNTLYLRKDTGCEYADTCLVEYKDGKNEQELLGVRCATCEKDWLKKDHLPDDNSNNRTKTYKSNTLYLRKQTGLKVPKACETQPNITLIREHDIISLKAGDHIAWHRSELMFVYWHHAIVVDVNAEKKSLKIIHWKQQDERDKQDEKKRNGKWVVAEEDKTVTKSEVLFKINYADIVDSVKLVLARARSFVVKSKTYDLLRNNCESLATFCKTGTSLSVQVRWAKEKVKEVLISSGGKAVIQGFISEGTEHAVGACNIVGSSIFGVSEILLLGIDIYELCKKYRAKEIESTMFIGELNGRCKEFLWGLGLGVIGGMICPQWFISALLTAILSLIGKKISRYYHCAQNVDG